MSTHSIHPISDADPLEDARVLPPGKVPGDLLTRLIRRLPTRHPQLLLGPGLGEDAAVIDFAPISPTSPGGDRLLVAKSDPITFATEEIGYYAVNVCANDLAVTGATLDVRTVHAEAAGARARLDAATAGERAAKAWLAAVLQADAVGTAEARDLADAYIAWFQMRARQVAAIFQWNVAVMRVRRGAGEFAAPPTRR